MDAGEEGVALGVSFLKEVMDPREFLKKIKVENLMGQVEGVRSR